MLDEPLTPSTCCNGGMSPNATAGGSTHAASRSERSTIPAGFIRIDLKDTALAELECDWSKQERSEHDWVHWRVADARYEAYCGPTNLNEAILAFLDLAGARQDV